MEGIEAAEATKATKKPARDREPEQALMIAMGETIDACSIRVACAHEGRRGYCQLNKSFL
jgi:hypothetical protein